MLLQKYIAVLLLIFSISITEQSLAQENTQDTIQQFNKDEFKTSLQKLGPKEFARLFTQEYKQDSIKAKISIAHIKENMLSSQDLLTQFWGNYSLARWQHDQLNHEESIILTNKLYVIALEMNNDDLILSSFISKANFYYEIGNYEESMEYNLKAIELLKNKKNIKRRLAVIHNIALIKLQINDYSGAIKLLKEMIEDIDGSSDSGLKNLKTGIYVALIKGYLGIEDYLQARTYCEKSIRLSRKNNDKESEFYSISFLGTIERIDKNYKKAHQLLNESLVIADEIKAVEEEIPLIYFEKGEVFYDEKKYDEAITILLKADSLMQKNELDFIKQEETYALLAKSYNEIGDIKNSVKFYEKASKAYKENDKRQGSMSVDVIKKYDLKALKEELNLAEKKTQKTRTILYGSIFLALATVIGLIFFYKKREQKNQQKFTAILKNLEEEKEILETTKVQEALFIKEEKEKLKEKDNARAKITSKKESTTTTEVKEVEIIDETKERLLKKLKNFETKELFLSKNSSLNEVAKKLKTNTSYLSKLVNAHKGKSFTAYITDLRVNYAIRRLKEDKKFRSYTIDSIAREIGFNRSESFSRAFKNKTGLYPSYYIKNLDSQNVV